MIGPGKYDKACTMVREMTDAACAMVVVIGGNKGAGFSMQTADSVNVAAIASLLEHIAKQLREDASP